MPASGREGRTVETMEAIGVSASARHEIHNARLSHRNRDYTEFLDQRLQRHGMLYRDCQRLVNQDRNVFAACMVACGDADGMVTGLTRNSFDVLDEVSRVIDLKPGSPMFGLTILSSQEHTVLLADTLVPESPSAAQRPV